jgi:hypothetical protein
VAGARAALIGGRCLGRKGHSKAGWFALEQTHATAYFGGYPIDDRQSETGVVGQIEVV